MNTGGESASYSTVDPALKAPHHRADEPRGTGHARRNQQFLRFWIAITLALTGLWVRITVQGYLVYDMSDDAFLLGLVGFLSALPVLLLTPIVGVVVDR